MDTTWQRREAGKRPLFSFAVVADSHMNPEDDTSSSPWEVNQLANNRATAVIGEINALIPDFVIHLGDMIHPVPTHDDYPAAADRFHALFGRLSVPLHVVPGNHDVGDKPLDWTPAAIVTEECVDLYERHFGKSYYSFEHEGCQFLVLNAQILNSGFASEAAQREWFEQTLAADPNARRFLFLHYPPYVHVADEPGHYDNLDEPARTWLLSLLHEYRVEAVFAGHVHNFFYDRTGETDFYVLPSISFVRSDYSEFSRVSPADDFHGRNDLAKLGYFLVEVWPEEHRTRIFRTYGRTAATVTLAAPDRILPSAPHTPVSTMVGVDLRHPWAEVVQIPYTGCLDEFARKQARNDYPLMALWEMGVSRLRVPLADLADEGTLARARLFALKGARFMPFTYGVPTTAEQSVLTAAREVLCGVEVIVQGDLAPVRDELAKLRATVGVPVFASRFHSHTDNAGRSGQFLHVINHGYLVDDRDLVRHEVVSEAADGLSFRVGIDSDPVATLAAIADFARKSGIRGLAHVRLAHDNPARAETNDLAAANRVAATLAVASAFPELDVYLDTLLDQDRGYFPRAGLLDRHFNPRMAANVVRNLNATLQPGAAITPLSGGAGYLLTTPEACQVLLLPDAATDITVIDLGFTPAAVTSATTVNLADGVFESISIRVEPDGIAFPAPLTIAVPTLIELAQ